MCSGSGSSVCAGSDSSICASSISGGISADLGIGVSGHLSYVEAVQGHEGHLAGKMESIHLGQETSSGAVGVNDVME